MFLLKFVSCFIFLTVFRQTLSEPQVIPNRIKKTTPSTTTTTTPTPTTTTTTTPVVTTTTSTPIIYSDPPPPTTTSYFSTESTPPPLCESYSCGGPFEIYSDCGSLCEGCKYAFGGLFCPEVCVPSCTCMSGYLRGPEGICIPKEKCPCPGIYDYDNDVYKPLSCSKFEDPKPFNRCLELCDKTNIRCNTADLTHGCYCKEGLCRDSKGRCVKAY